MEAIANFLSKLLEGLDIKKKWLVIGGAIFLILLTLVAFETTTGFFYYQNLEKKVALLSEMQKIAQNDVLHNADLYPIYQATIKEIEAKNIQPLVLASPSFSIEFFKALSGATLWILFAVLGLFGTFGKENKAGLTQRGRI